MPFWTPGRTFALVFTTNLLTNFDSGALPGVLNQLRATPQYAQPDAGAAEPPAQPSSTANLTATADEVRAVDEGVAPQTVEAPAETDAHASSSRRGRHHRLAAEAPAAEGGAERRECIKDCHGFSLSYVACGVLGSLPYIALSIVSPFVGAFLQRANIRGVLVTAVFWNGIACILFGLSPTVWLLMATRFAVGLSQAFAVIYFPVWVDSYAPAHAKTTYMSMMQVGVPLGIVLGYLSGGLVTSYAHTDGALIGGWRWPFIAQGAVLVPLGVLFASVPRRTLEVGSDQLALTSPRKRNSGSRLPSPAASPRLAPTEVLGVRAMLMILLRSRVFVWVLLCLSSIFFIVSGIQYWVTIFLLDYFHMEPATVVLSFSLVSSTGPLIGVLAGGWIVDRAGGYTRHSRCLRVLANYTVVGIGLAAGIALSESAVVVIVLIWCLLVVGGAVLAPATGVLLTAVPAAVRTFASAISMMAYNVLGYFLAPAVSGVVIEYFGIRWGFRLVVSWVLFSCLFLFLAICAADAAEAWSSAPNTAPPSGARTPIRANDSGHFEPQRTFSLLRDESGQLVVAPQGARSPGSRGPVGARAGNGSSYSQLL